MRIMFCSFRKSQLTVNSYLHFSHLSFQIKYLYLVLNYITVNAAELQTAFLKQIKNQLPSHLALVDAIAEQLNLSNDSAYRRIRGEKHLTFDEIQILASL